MSVMEKTRLRRVGSRGKTRAARLRALRPEVLARWGGRCGNPWCRKKTALDLDHVEKRWRVRPGLETVESLVPLCRPCHRAKDVPEGRGDKLGIVRQAAGDRVPYGQAWAYGFRFWWA